METSHDGKGYQKIIEISNETKTDTQLTER